MFQSRYTTAQYYKINVTKRVAYGCFLALIYYSIKNIDYNVAVVIL